jgi:RimJ/RimL family protein N-acetyltransferase
MTLARDLETPRLVLEPSGLGRLDELWDAIDSSRPDLENWLLWAAAPEPDGTREFLEASERAWADDTFGEWAFAIIKDGTAIGGVGLNRGDARYRRAEMGYWIRSDQAGQGFMTEAASAVASFGFDVAGLHRIELHAAPANIPSIRVAEKLGFQHEGLLRDGVDSVDGWQDVYVYGLLETDPRPAFHL